MIFLTIVGSWTGAWAYDRRQKKLVQKKWCDAVRHLAEETLPANQLQRKMTVFLSAPPAEGVMVAREHFHEYVKPILVAAAMDWDAVEGRREGDVRAQLATRIRRQRSRKEQGKDGPIEVDVEDNVEEIRSRLGVSHSVDVGGDIVIGRHTWKEYVRGLHEGWLGPLEQPVKVQEEDELNGNGNGDISEEKPPRDRPHDIGSIPNFAAEKVLERATKGRHKHDDSSAPVDASPSLDQPSSSESSEQDQKPKDEEQKEEEPEKKKKKQPPPFISTSDYVSASLPQSIPDELAPSITIPFPHILGFRNTPIRIYRYLTRRNLADDIGRQVASAVLASYRPYHHSEGSFSPDVVEDGASPAARLDGDDAPPSSSSARTVWEQQSLLKSEEVEWHKSARKREEGDEKERTWLDPMVLDDRIAGRMRTFELSAEEDDRARRVGEGKEGPIQRTYQDE